MPVSFRTSFRRITLAAAAAATLAGGPAQAADCSSVSLAYERAVGLEKRMARDHSDSTAIYGGCSALAFNQYRSTGSASQARDVLVGCATVGCALTASWTNCIAVNVTLFFAAVDKSNLLDRYRGVCFY